MSKDFVPGCICALTAAALLVVSTGRIAAEPVGAGIDAGDRTAAAATRLREKQWIHGSADCSRNTNPPIEIFRYDRSSYILRQNKCLSYEAPFIYLLLGDDKALVLDTGATRNASDFPLYRTIRTLLDEQSGHDAKAARELLVVHSHSHRDHHSGDFQFEGQPEVTIVEPNHAAMAGFFGFNDWPDGVADLELGGRRLSIIPTPGHQEDAIAVYDPQTRWLITGDTLYPGYIYVKHWEEYEKSISRLVSFAAAHEISAVLGAHIEMTGNAGEYYPIGTVYQPNEASLVLAPEALASLESALERSDGAQEIDLGQFIVVPMSTLQKFISNIARWIIK